MVSRAQIDRLVTSTTESDQQLRDVMQEKFAGLEHQVTGQLKEFRDHQGQTSEQLKDSVQTNFSRLGSELRETNKELSGKVQGSLARSDRENSRALCHERAEARCIAAGRRIAARQVDREQQREA